MRRRPAADPVRRDAAHLDLPDRPGRRGLPPGARPVGRGRGQPDVDPVPPVGGRAFLDAEQIFAITTDGFEVFERHFDFPYPFGKYDQVFVPEYNGGAMENVGCVTLRDEYLFRSKVTAASPNYRRDTILHELSHMWFGDLVTMALVGRPLAEGVVRHLGLQLRGQRAGRRPGAALGRVRQQLQDPGLPARSTSVHPSGGGRHRRPRGGRVELRPDHLRQGRLGAGPAGRLRRPGGLPERGAGLLRRARVRQHRARPTCWHSLEQASGRDLSQWSAQWLETAGVNTLRLELTPTSTGVITAGCGGTDRARAVADPAPAPDRPRPLRPGRRAAGPGRADRDRHRRAAYAGARAGSAVAGRTRSWSTTTT